MLEIAQYYQVDGDPEDQQQPNQSRSAASALGRDPPGDDEIENCYPAEQQFKHGEQGALIAIAKIVQTVPDLDAKFYAATRVMEEARHVEAYSRLLHENSNSLTRSRQGSNRCSTTV